MTLYEQLPALPSRVVPLVLLMQEKQISQTVILLLTFASILSLNSQTQFICSKLF